MTIIKREMNLLIHSQTSMVQSYIVNIMVLESTLRRKEPVPQQARYKPSFHGFIIIKTKNLKQYRVPVFIIIKTKV